MELKYKPAVMSEVQHCKNMTIRDNNIFVMKQNSAVEQIFGRSWGSFLTWAVDVPEARIDNQELCPLLNALPHHQKNLILTLIAKNCV